MTSAVDKARCNDSGKQVVTVRHQRRQEAGRHQAVRRHGPGDNAQMLVCKQVDLNHDDKVDIVYHYDDAGR